MKKAFQIPTWTRVGQSESSDHLDICPDPRYPAIIAVYYYEAKVSLRLTSKPIADVGRSWGGGGGRTRAKLFNYLGVLYKDLPQLVNFP